MAITTLRCGRVPRSAIGGLDCPVRLHAATDPVSVAAAATAPETGGETPGVVNYVDARKRLVDWLRRQLIGPAQEGSLEMSPLDRYPTGVLHPVEADVTGVDPASIGDAEAESNLFDDFDDHETTSDSDGVDDTQSLARPTRRRRYVPPSSVGFSCYVRGPVRLSITATAATYESTGERGERGQFRTREYTRTELPEAAATWSITPDARIATETIWEARAGIDIRARPHRDGCILTVTLCNRSELEPDTPARERTRERVTKSLFEAGLACVVESGELVDYPRVDPGLLTEEEQELELQYRELSIYAVGHGAAVNWDVRPQRAARIWSEFMPATEVPMVNTDGDDDVLGLERLAERPIRDDLDRFVDGYADWVAGQERTDSLPPGTTEKAAAERMSRRMNVALDRMRACIDMLRNDQIARESFQLANRAMLEQMYQADRAAGRDTERNDYHWRPFQLAFLLTVLVSATREDDEFRDVLDLIWFPTGGGKTEAYLGLIAFLIVWRRLTFPDTGAAPRHSCVTRSAC